jgi:hypothetical protein
MNYNAMSEKSITHGEGSDQIQRTERNSRTRHTGFEKAAWDLRLEPSVYEVCSFRLQFTPVTSVTV